MLKINHSDKVINNYIYALKNKELSNWKSSSLLTRFIILTQDSLPVLWGNNLTNIAGKLIVWFLLLWIESVRFTLGSNSKKWYVSQSNCLVTDFFFHYLYTKFFMWLSKGDEKVQLPNINEMVNIQKIDCSR